MKCLLLRMELDDTYFMQKAIEQAELAFEIDVVPVGAGAVSYTHLTRPTKRIV